MAAESQFKVLTTDAVQVALEDQRKALGFLSNNNLAAIYITALSAVPAEKVWEVLALIAKHQKAPQKPRRNLL